MRDQGPSVSAAFAALYEYDQGQDKCDACMADDWDGDERQHDDECPIWMALRALEIAKDSA